MNNSKEIAEFLKEEYIKQRADNYVIVVALVAFVCKGVINKCEFKEILYFIFDNDEYIIIKSLRIVSKYIDKEMIDAIIGE